MLYFYEMVNPAHLASRIGYYRKTRQLFKTYKAGTVSGKNESKGIPKHTEVSGRTPSCLRSVGPSVVLL